MPRPSITFQKQQGQSGRTIPGQDYVSGFVFYCPSNKLPSGFTTSANFRQLYALPDAIANGILNDYSDGTGAVATYEITTLGAVGNVITISVNDLVIGSPTKQLNQLCSYTEKNTDTTIALLGASIAAAINANTLTTGYSATFLTATLTITGPKSLGIFLNSGTPLVVTIVGSIAGTIVQFTGGLGSSFIAWYYHISEFFRIQNGSNGTDGLFVGYYPVPETFTGGEVNLLSNASAGVIRNIAVYKNGVAYAAGDIQLISNACVVQDNLKKNLSALYGADLSAVDDISTLTDLSTLTANKCSDIISQDGGLFGAFLYLTLGYSITNIGAELGALSLSAVSEDFGQPIAKFNISAGPGLENDTVAFANGVLMSDPSISDTLLDSLNDKRHIFLQTYVGLSGSYFNDNHTAIVVSSDYAYINDNRTIDKAIRGIYVAVLPTLKGRIPYTTGGQIQQTTIQSITALALAPLYQMNRDGDLSDVASTDVYINPSQNVRSTSTLTLNVALNEDGIARNIIVPIGFKPATS